MTKRKYPPKPKKRNLDGIKKIIRTYRTRGDDIRRREAEGARQTNARKKKGTGS